MAAPRCGSAGSSTSSRPCLARGVALCFLGWAASTGALALSTKTPVKKAPRPPGTNVLRRKNPDLFDAASPDATPAAALRKPEVMAPAGGWPQLRAAVANGADAVYFGLSTHSARARATNFDEGAELDDVVAYLRHHEVKGYVALNTLAFDDEFDAVEALIRRCDAAGVDAIIVQDLGVMALAKAVAPGLPVHASTQQSIASADGAEFARARGATRVVVGRELSTAEIAAVVAHTAAEVECFVHGALCACRLPYEVLVDGAGDQADGAATLNYALSPQDLCGLEDVEALTKAGVHCLKIEGRLKDERYVAATTRAYREAVDAAWAKLRGDDADATPTVSRSDLAQVFSRGQSGDVDGLSAGFLRGPRHQSLVVGNAPRHRGVYVGEVLSVAPATKKQGLTLRVRSELEDLKRGDGVVIDGGADHARDEVGGALYDVKQVAGGFDVTFAKAVAARPWVRAGARVWRTADAAVDAKLRGLASSKPLRRTEVDVRVSVDGGELVVEIDDGVRVGAAKTPVDARRRADALRRLAPARASARAPPGAARALLERGDGSLLDDGFDESLLEFKVGVAVLVRDLDQCAAAVDYALTTPPSDDFSVDEVVLDFLELKGLREAVAAIRERAPGLNVVVAAPRISLPGEDGALEKLLALGPDALLARSPGQLRYFAGRDVELRGDFSLNAANALTANDLFDDAAALTRLTPAHDLGGAAVARLARRLTPSRRAKLEAVAHQHLPIFHASHCLYARHLSKGDSFENCGHVCERHTIHLRDEAGADHVVLADMGCRNTVFNAQAQSAADALGSWLDAGISRYRVEFVDESPAAVAAVLGAYRDLFLSRGELPEPLWSLLADVPDANGAPQGAGVGSLKDGERKSGKARKTTGQHRAHYK
ncbi:collagenase [Aureococcus anophagefferens]|nr:collagenase [Aureococcus anophagefferens]